MKVCNHRFAFDYKQRSSSDSGSGSTSGRDSESVVRRVVDGQEETSLVFVTFPSCAHTTVCFQSFFLWLLLFIFC